MGSSSTTRRGEPIRVRAIATACRCPADSSDSGVRTDGIRRVRSRRIPRAICSMRPSSSSAPPVSSRPRKMFDVTSRLPHRARSWNTVAMPRACAADGDGIVCSTPSISIRPESGASTPEITLASVDLPAPLSPTSATTWWAYTSRSTPTRASTAPNRRLICRRDSSGTRGLSLMTSPAPRWACTCSETPPGACVNAPPSLHPRSSSPVERASSSDRTTKSVDRRTSSRAPMTSAR